MSIVRSALPGSSSHSFEANTVFPAPDGPCGASRVRRIRVSGARGEEGKRRRGERRRAAPRAQRRPRGPAGRRRAASAPRGSTGRSLGGREAAAGAGAFCLAPRSRASVERQLFRHARNLEPLLAGGVHAADKRQRVLQEGGRAPRPPAGRRRRVRRARRARRRRRHRSTWSRRFAAPRKAVGEAPRERTGGLRRALSRRAAAAAPPAVQAGLPRPPRLCAPPPAANGG